MTGTLNRGDSTTFVTTGNNAEILRGTLTYAFLDSMV